MKIAFDAKRAAQNRTGLGNYSRFILHCFSMYGKKENQYILYIPNLKKVSLLNGLINHPSFFIRSPHFLWKKFKSLWRIWDIPSDLNKQQINIYHGLSNELPLNIHKAKSVKSIVTIHDLIFLHFPQYYKPIDRIIYNYKFRKACENADRIIAVSECTKRDIINYYHIQPQKIDVVYQGCDNIFSHIQSQAIKEKILSKYQIKKPYILSVGSIEERKNLLLLARALKLLPEDIHVVAIGKRTPYEIKIEKFLQNENMKERFRIINNVPYTDLPALYQSASIFVYPSRFEGFGIPMLEALNSGIPAIGCTGSCLEEAGGPHSIYVSPDDEKELARTIQQILNNKDLSKKMIIEGKVYAQKFNDNKLYLDLVNSYKKALEKE